MRDQPVPECPVVALRINVLDRERGTPRGDPLGRCEVAVAQQRSGEMCRRREEAASQHGVTMTGSQNHYLEPWLQLDTPATANPLEQRAVCGTAAQKDVLTVVECPAVPVDRVGSPTQAWAHLDQSNFSAAIGAIERRGDTRNPAADDENARRTHAACQSRLASATRALTATGRLTRPSRIRSGRTSMRSSRLP